MNPKYPKIGAAVKEARLAKKWSQERAAAEVGTSRIHWIRWEQGLHRPTGDFAKRLITLGVPRELLEDDDAEEEALALALQLLDIIRRVQGVTA